MLPSILSSLLSFIPFIQPPLLFQTSIPSSSISHPPPHSLFLMFFISSCSQLSSCFYLHFIQNSCAAWLGIMRLFLYNFKPSLHPFARVLKQCQNKYFDIQTQEKMGAMISCILIHLLKYETQNQKEKVLDEKNHVKILYCRRKTDSSNAKCF